MLKKFRKDDDGSLTLEAAMVMPIFLLFVVFLATIIRISVADLALRNAVNNTAEILATHAYPAYLAEKAAKSKIDDTIKNYTQDQFDLEQATKLAKGVLEKFNINLMDYVSSISGAILTPVVKENFKESNKDQLFKDKSLEIKVEPPSTLENSYIGIIGTYRVSITAPFVNKKITLQKKAYERLWTGS